LDIAVHVRDFFFCGGKAGAANGQGFNRPDIRRPENSGFGADDLCHRYFYNFFSYLVSERLNLENLFKQNEKRPEGSAGGVVHGFASPKFRILSEEDIAARRKFYQTTAAIAVFLLGFITTLGFIKKQAFIQEQPVIGLEKKSEYILAEIAGLTKIDPGRAIGLAQEFSESISGFQKGINDKKLLNRTNNLQQKLVIAQSELGLVRRAKLTEFLDPKLLRDGLNAEVLTGNGEKLLIFDPQKNILATVSQIDRSGQVIGGGIDGIKNVALGRNSAFGIKDNRIIEFPFEGGEQAEAVKEEESWGADSILAWFGGNIYIVDKSASEILKYPAVEKLPGKSELGSRRPWFKPGLNYDLTDMVGVEVDGDVWALHQGGRISRFRNGNRISFKQVLADFVSEPSLFSVPLEGEKIWVLSRKEKKVVVLNKETGEFEGVWETEEFAKTQGLAVNEKLGKMFVLIDGKIYAGEIK
jgi:hypothetical protein